MHGDRRAAVDENVGNAEGGENADFSGAYATPGFQQRIRRAAYPRRAAATFAPISMAVFTRSRLPSTAASSIGTTALAPGGRSAARGNPHRRCRHQRELRSGAHHHAGDELEIARRRLRLQRKTIHQRTRGIGVIVVGSDAFRKYAPERVSSVTTRSTAGASGSAREKRDDRLLRREQTFRHKSAPR